ncbi:MAG: hypothetical protein PVH61_01715 [Candidatus Aminicenantes bacterium]|jgi:hypothetical protein
MKPKKSEFPSIYDEKQFKRVGLRVNLFYLFAILIILLVVFRFINLTMWWFTTHLELTNKPSDKQIKYTSLHLATHERAKEKCLELSQRSPAANVIVVSYFNLLHPGIFLVLNKAKHSMVDLGRIVIPLGPGLFTFRIHLTDRIEKQWGQTVKRTRFATSILLSFFIKEEPAAGKDISFILKSIEKTEYLDIPYLIYFYLPLVLILIFSSFYSRAVFTSFFFYTGLFLLFDFKTVLFRVPFGWLTQLFNIQDTTAVDGGGAVVVAVLFTMLGFYGLFNWKNRRDIFKEKLIVLFFLLLPIFLRF